MPRKIKSQISQSNPGGNTKPPGKIPQFQLYCWFFTLKVTETSQEAEELAEHLKTFCKKFTFQKESGEKTGYIHWQGCFTMITKEYFQTVKNRFCESIHLEPTKDVFASKNYCSKSETRLEGPYDEKYVFIDTIKRENFKHWQNDIMKIIATKPDYRTIHWYWEPNGNVGKTSFCKYLAVHKTATVLGNGAFKDLAQAIGDSPKIVCFNITRDLEERINYSALEAIKDGLVFSGKYESKTKVFNCPHVFVFANFEPRLDAMSADRWIISRIR